MMCFNTDKKINRIEIHPYNKKNTKHDDRQPLDADMKQRFGKICKAIEAQLLGPWTPINLTKWDDDLVICKFTPFQRKIYDALCQVPRGDVITYKDLGIKAGTEKAFRAVGDTMRRNPFLVFIPCHRVVPHDYTTGNYAAGSAIKPELLQLEGVRFSSDLKIAR